MRAMGIGIIVTAFVGAACGDDATGSGDVTSADTAVTTATDTAATTATDAAPTTATDSAVTTATDTTLPADVTSNGSGYIEVGSTAIVGRSGLVFIAFGPNQQTRYCVPIESDSFVVPYGRLTLNEDNPCGFETADILFPAGPHEVTAAVFAPGETTPIVAATRTVTVDGDATVTFDGAELSARTGAPGKLTLTSTPITGQAGRVLLVLATDTLARACVPIDASPFTLPPTPMTELLGNPCGEATAAVTFSGGEQHLTGGVYVPGEQSPTVQLSVMVLVDGDTTYEIDGASLSR